MYAKIGDIVLSGALGMEEVESEYSANLVELELIGEKPVVQPIAFNLDTKKLAVILHSAFCTPESIIETFKGYEINNTPINITLGSGEDVGNFFVRSVKTSIIQSTPTGQLIQCRVELDLLEYTGVMPTPAPPAMASSLPVVEPRLNIPVSPPLSAAVVTNVTTATAASADLNNTMAQATAAPSGTTQQKAITKALLRVQNINNSLSNAYTFAGNATELANEAVNLKARIQLAQAQLQSLKAFLQIKDIGSANVANQNFQASMFQVGNLTSPFTQSYFFRRSVN